MGQFGCVAATVPDLRTTREASPGILRLDLLASVDEQKLDAEATIGVRCSSVTSHQRQSVLDGRCADECIVHCAARNPECAQSGEQLAGSAITEKTRGGKVVRDEPCDRARTPTRRRRQPREDGKRLECGMAGKAKCPAAKGVDRGAMVLVIGHHERYSEAGIDRASASSTALLAAVGVTQRLHQLVVDADTRRRYHEASVGLYERVLVYGHDPQRRPVRGQLNLSWPQPQLIAQCLRDDQTACLVNG
jgi:hypothetical protein